VKFFFKLPEVIAQYRGSFRGSCQLSLPPEKSAQLKRLSCAVFLPLLSNEECRFQMTITR